MISHGEKCKFCCGNMSAPKMTMDGPRKGQMKTICMKCGHTHYFTAPQPDPEPAPDCEPATELAGT